MTIASLSNKFLKISLIIAATATVMVWESTLPISDVSAQEDQFPGKRVVHVTQEPRHRTVYHRGDMYLIDVQINPGDMSLPHTHNQPIMYTSISRGDGPRAGEVSSNIAYATEPLTHEVPNPGPGLFRIIAMVNDGPGNDNLSADRPTGLNGEPQLENRWFRSYRVELEPGESTAIQTHEFDSAIIQVAAGLIHVTREDSLTAELDTIADWTWRNAESPYMISNVGNVATAVVVNEGRN